MSGTHQITVTGPLKSGKWRWSLTAKHGWSTDPIADGETDTGIGALYAAVMEARLYEPNFQPVVELLRTIESK